MITKKDIEDATLRHEAMKLAWEDLDKYDQKMYLSEAKKKINQKNIERKCDIDH